MNAVMFARPLAALLRGGNCRISFTGEGRTGGRAREILAAQGIPDAREAGRLAVRWRGWDAYISPDLYMPARRARRSIQIFHGVSFKGKMFTPPIQRFSDLFLVGEDQRRRFIEKKLFAADSPALHKVGMPKLDAFFDGSQNREAILRELGADPSRPMVLYAPTWRPEASLYGAGLEFIKESARERRWTLVVKLHDWALDPKTNPIDWRQAIPQLENENVRFARGFNAVPYMFAADALVSDASSVANEYLLLNRPLVWLDAPELIRKYERTIDLDGWGRKTGPIVKTAGELRESLAAALAGPGEHAATRQAAAADLFYNPGRATQAFLAELGQLLDEKKG